MSRRKPGQSAIVTQRKEPDDVQFYRVFWRKNNRYSIGFVIPNTNQKSDDYSHIKDNYRAMRIMFMKNTEPAYRGGGRSARERRAG
jgi:chorismate synthase